VENAYYKEKLFWKSLYGGFKSYLPQFNEFRGTGGSDNSKYCYSVWLRHLNLINQSTKPLNKEKFLEIGPGDSLGVTFCAYLSGFNQCSAIEVVDHLQKNSLNEIARSLIEYYEAQQEIPGNLDFPNLAPKIKDHSFNKEKYIQNDFAERQSNLLKWCDGFSKKRQHKPIEYKVAPWLNQTSLFKDLDLILAQSVFQYLNTEEALNTIRPWLKTGGLISTQIDYSSHGLTIDFNGHWAIPEIVWKLIKGKRPFFLNRKTHSETKETIEKCGFKIIYSQPELRRSVLTQESSLLKRTRYEKLPKSDFEISHSHFILEKI
jgi:hypothetical protein